MVQKSHCCISFISKNPHVNRFFIEFLHNDWDAYIIIFTNFDDVKLKDLGYKAFQNLALPIEMSDHLHVQFVRPWLSWVVTAACCRVQLVN